jgi:hypothetical protein
MCLEGRVPSDRPFHVPQGGFRAVAVNIVNGGRDRIVINESAEGPPGVVDQIDRVVDQLRIVGRILPLEDVMEMRRQGFDDRVMEGPQNIRQEFLLGCARSALGARPAGQEVPFPSSLSDWGLISMCQQFCCGLSG